MLKFRCTVSKSNSSNAWEHSRSVVFRPTLLPDLSALLSPLKPEVTSLIRRPRGDRQLGGTSTLSGSCNNGWKRRRCRASQRRTLDGNRLHCAATDNGTVRRRYAAFTPDKCSPDTSCIDLYPLVSLVDVYMTSCIGDKIVVTATCVHLYPRVEHCLELHSFHSLLFTGRLRPIFMSVYHLL